MAAECNAELAAWIERNVPSAVVLDEVTQDGAEWEAERAWTEKFADLSLFNKYGNPAKSPRRRGGQKPPVAGA